MLYGPYTFNSLVAARAVEEELLEVARMRAIEHEVPFDDIITLLFWIRLALEEVLVNHIKHGHQHEPSLVATAQATIEAVEGNNERIIYESWDQGPGFNPSDVPDCTHPERLECGSGRGLLLTRAGTKKYGGTVEYLGNGNRVRMSFLLKPPPSESTP